MYFLLYLRLFIWQFLLLDFMRKINLNFWKLVVTLAISPFQNLVKKRLTKGLKMGESSASYIRLVQHLIEKCLCFKMSKEDCIEALDKHANIKPVITSTVWNELEKENKEFFDEYKKGQEGRRIVEMETIHTIQNMFLESSPLKHPK
ncbi:hypothetical protein LUZ60_011119 [Juncus effusus]|nr:hypothetical protein LUZ60_011119 [Juncus effusus]